MAGLGTRWRCMRGLHPTSAVLHAVSLCPSHPSALPKSRAPTSMLNPRANTEPVRTSPASAVRHPSKGIASCPCGYPLPVAPIPHQRLAPPPRSSRARRPRVPVTGTKDRHPKRAPSAVSSRASSGSPPNETACTRTRGTRTAADCAPVHRVGVRCTRVHPVFSPSM
ncbi:hypothetical protein B0H15DRAFT_945220 [Mycena belliarum]|uniref:Uncharacterized protein n=1 Tax=Mycena belliarum TaxID=1033014 RepID=A0AAD6UDV6_9AGAR|nr:hypothetical protein B0H15DRAFT_945220 [Mycena belliae]